MTSDHLHRIVIVGGGAGGLPLACALGDKLGRKGRAEVPVTAQVLAGALVVGYLAQLVYAPIRVYLAMVAGR